jgi:phosphoserine phosphatase
MKPIISIWDIDKTLYDGYAIIDFGTFLEEEGKFSKGFKEEIISLKKEYDQNEITYEEFASSVYKIYGKYIFNKNQYEILQLSKIFWDKNIVKIYPAAMDLYKFLNKFGSEHAAISGSSFESLYYLADQLKFIKIKTTEYETIDGNFTDKIVSKLVSHYDKSRLKDRVLNQKTKYKITIGIGDNYADYAFLKLVDIPIVMGMEDQKLVNVAKDKGWTIIRDVHSTISKEISAILRKRMKEFAKR